VRLRAGEAERRWGRHSKALEPGTTGGFQGWEAPEQGATGGFWGVRGTGAVGSRGVRHWGCGF
jgi:hypothetical protein